jgi:hypothetical protein
MSKVICERSFAENMFEIVLSSAHRHKQQFELLEGLQTVARSEKNNINKG